MATTSTALVPLGGRDYLMKIAEPNQELCKIAQLPTFPPNEITAILKRRTEMDATELAVFTRTFIVHHGKLETPLLKEVKRRFSILDRSKQVDGTYLTIDGARSFNEWLGLHGIGKRNAYYILHGGKAKKEKEGKVHPPPPWGKIDGTQVDVVFSAAHKCVRRGNETDAIAWIRLLHLNGFHVWKQLKIYAMEDVGLGDTSVLSRIDMLEKSADAVKDLPHHPELLAIIEAVMILCRAKKSRATDNAAIWFQENPTYVPPTEDEVQEASEVELVTPPVYEEYLDKHTAAGRHNGRGLEDFKKTENEALSNKADVAPFVPPLVDVTDAEVCDPDPVPMPSDETVDKVHSADTTTDSDPRTDGMDETAARSVAVVATKLAKMVADGHGGSKDAKAFAKEIVEVNEDEPFLPTEVNTTANLSVIQRLWEKLFKDGSYTMPEAAKKGVITRFVNSLSNEDYVMVGDAIFARLDREEKSVKTDCVGENVTKEAAITAAGKKGREEGRADVERVIQNAPVSDEVKAAALATPYMPKEAAAAAAGE